MRDARSCSGKGGDVAVPKVLFAGLGALVVLLAPWRDLGLIPTEIGGVKFERIVKAQKKEQIDAIVPLQEELKVLKAKLEVLSRVVEDSSPGLLEKQEKPVGAEAARLAPPLNEEGHVLPPSADEAAGLVSGKLGYTIPAEFAVNPVEV